jgi:hypothetical protein
MPVITSISVSPFRYKRFRVHLSNFTHFDFGLHGASTYIDHYNKKLKSNYQARHYANKTEHYLIDNLIPSPALFSYYLLWGPYISLYKNVRYLNNLLSKNI